MFIVFKKIEIKSVDVRNRCKKIMNYFLFVAVVTLNVCTMATGKICFDTKNCLVKRSIGISIVAVDVVLTALRLRSSSSVLYKIAFVKSNVTSVYINVTQVR